MKHRLFYAGKAFAMDSVIRHTHALMGRRADHVERPEALDKSPKERTPDEREAVADHARRSARGFYAPSVLAWAESEEQAETLRQRFPAPDWVDVQVVRVNAVANA